LKLDDEGYLSVEQLVENAKRFGKNHHLRTGPSSRRWPRLADLHTERRRHSHSSRPCGRVADQPWPAAMTGLYFCVTVTSFLRKLSVAGGVLQVAAVTTLPSHTTLFSGRSSAYLDVSLAGCVFACDNKGLSVESLLTSMTPHCFEKKTTCPNYRPPASRLFNRWLNVMAFRWRRATHMVIAGPQWQRLDGPKFQPSRIRWLRPVDVRRHDDGQRPVSTIN